MGKKKKTHGAVRAPRYLPGPYTLPSATWQQQRLRCSEKPLPHLPTTRWDRYFSSGTSTTFWSGTAPHTHTFTHTTHHTPAPPPHTHTHTPHTPTPSYTFVHLFVGHGCFLHLPFPLHCLPHLPTCFCPPFAHICTRRCCRKDVSHIQLPDAAVAGAPDGQRAPYKATTARSP